MWQNGARAEIELDRSDEELLAAVAKGSEPAFLAIYRRRQASIYRYAVHVGGDGDLAAEVVQETFLALLRDAHRLDPAKGTVIAWLFAVARNQVVRQLRQRRLHASLEDEPASEPAANGSAAEELELGQLTVRLRETLATLPAVYREALVLCDMQELSYEEVAAIAGCPVGTVRSRLHRARALLAEKLRPLARYSS